MYDIPAKDVRFVHVSAEEYASRMPEGSFTVAVANMTLNTAPPLENLVGAVAGLLAPGGHFVFALVHPCFWPLYWGYSAEPWFDYK